MLKKSLFIPFSILIVFNAIGQSIPEGYYDGTDGLRGEALKIKLHTIIRDHRVRAYSEFRDTIIPDLDEDPNNSDNLIVFYKNASVPKSDFAIDNDSWNREHTWPSSHGFPETSDTTYTDAHNLRPSDASVNTSKSNKDFNDVPNIEENAQGEAPDTYTTSDFWDPRDEIKGDVARILFYMDTRYDSKRLDLKLVDRESFSSDPELGVLYTLIKWHEQDPVDQAELERHEGAYGYQENRNPFVDHPEWVAEVFGSATEPTIIVNEVSFSRDFGSVEAGSELTQQYSVNVYNHASDISILTSSPFSVSADGTNFADSVGFTNNSSGEQSETIFIKFAPTETGQTFENTVTHYVEGDTAKFNVSGAEGEQQVLTIAEARQESLGEIVTVTGVVIDMGNNSSNSRVLYDGTAGIVVRSFDAGNESAPLVQGDSVEVSGGLGEFNNLLQISESPITISLLKSDAVLPNPDTVMISDIGEDYESELVIVKNLRFQDVGGTFAGGGSSGNFIVLDENDDELIFRLGSDDHPLVGTEIPEGIFNITGFVGQFGSDYQLSPRTESDLTLVSDGTSNGTLITIREARRINLGEEVIVTGVVIDEGNNSNDNRIIFDGTAGIVVRSFDEGNESAQLVQGDSVLVTGGLSEFNGTLQIEKSPISIELIASNIALAAPQEISIADVSENYESELVTLSDLTFTTSGTFERGNYILSDGSDELTLRIGLSTHPLVNTDIPEGTVTVVGYIGQSQDDYYLFPRSINDITVTGAPVLGTSKNIQIAGMIYPNPVVNSIQLTLPVELSKGDYNGKVSGINGQTVQLFKTTDQSINVSGLSDGLYIISIEKDGKIYTSKFIKE